MSHPSPRYQILNRLLTSLDPVEFGALEPHLKRVALDQGFLMEAPGRPIETVYFPEPGVVSVVGLTRGGMRLEAGLVGPEGMTGLALVNGIGRSPNETFVQIPCQALCLEAHVLRSAIESSRVLHYHFLAYAHVFSIQLVQTILANGRLTIGERLARWLMMCHDRVDREDLPLTHEFLSLMLGVRRAGVTTALQVLEGSGAIRMRRGVISVRDRALLLAAAGDAYGTPEDEYERVMRRADPGSN